MDFHFHVFRVNWECQGSFAMCHLVFDWLPDFAFVASIMFGFRPPRIHSRMSRELYSRSHLDTAPPRYNGPFYPLDKSAFQKSIPVLAARVPASQTSSILRSEVTRKYLIGLPKIRPVVSDPSAPDSDRLVLLGVSDPVELSPESLKLIESNGNGFTLYNLVLDYDYWTASELLQAILPEELREGAPVGFAATGHVAHVNLNDEYLPYKKTIGQLFLDKNKTIRTVVNKLDNIDTQFRFFQMEVIAGEPDFIVEHHESDCRFTFDFSRVYWNSRLHTEHDRIVQSVHPGEVLADVFAGVGPFTIPAAKKGCAVMANDLNPASYTYLCQNVKDNEVSEEVRTFCEDGRNFIRNVFRRVYDTPFPAYTGPKLSKTALRKLQKQTARDKPVIENPPSQEFKPPRRKIDHFVMNLPDTAILFLDAFRGVFADKALREVYSTMPIIHCHCFTRESELEQAEIDIRQRVEEKLEVSLQGDVEFKKVRSVAPGKEMYCVSFRLPPEVACNTKE
ncbi:Met-10+ like-protein-domain-containing protein [Lentinula boryana]|uniref:tRNA (guanine(37)-N1)-methyltransferase n=1 Tax=Lentinula boryana TaxID=40481 RepID=A0ABQ8QV61_9AGAR|nr:Met-10+ like-protein-domain-containing protein [Lentinula boryana]